MLYYDCTAAGFLLLSYMQLLKVLLLFLKLQVWFKNVSHFCEVLLWHASLLLTYCNFNHELTAFIVNLPCTLSTSRIPGRAVIIALCSLIFFVTSFVYKFSADGNFTAIPEVVRYIRFGKIASIG